MSFGGFFKMLQQEYQLVLFCVCSILALFLLICLINYLYDVVQSPSSKGNGSRKQRYSYIEVSDSEFGAKTIGDLDSEIKQPETQSGNTTTTQEKNVTETPVSTTADEITTQDTIIPTSRLVSTFLNHKGKVMSNCKNTIVNVDISLSSETIEARSKAKKKAGSSVDTSSKKVCKRHYTPKSSNANSRNLFKKARSLSSVTSQTEDPTTVRNTTCGKSLSSFSSASVGDIPSTTFEYLKPDVQGTAKNK
uniref:Uncharacterized protein n=1 Tax=Rhabditophanes sp. KR3021 TaxID=114890 RepID=A0AC35TTB5_9BILA